VLPQSLLLTGYNQGFGDGLLVYQPDAGPSMARRRSSAVQRPLTVSFVLSRDQLATLETFFNVTILGGSLPFEFPSPISEETYLVKFQKDGIPKWTAISYDDFSVTMTLWILP